MGPVLDPSALCPGTGVFRGSKFGCSFGPSRLAPRGSEHDINWILAYCKHGYRSLIMRTTIICPRGIPSSDSEAMKDFDRIVSRTVCDCGKLA